MKYGANLHTIRDFMQTHKDFAGSMKRLSRNGFNCVRVSGVGADIPMEEIAETCQAHGLEIILTSTCPQRLRDNTAEVILEHKIMGAKHIGISTMPQKYERNRTGLMQFVLDFKPLARAAKEEGLQLVYHNRHFEFEKYDGKLAIEFLRDNLFDVNFVLDTYWAQAGGADPAHWTKRLGARLAALHINDFAVVGGASRICEVMEGNLNWVRIMNAAKEAGVEYCIIGQDECFGKYPFECLGTSLFNIRNKLSKVEFPEGADPNFAPQFIDRKLSNAPDELIW